MNNFIKSSIKWIIFGLPVVALLAPSGMFFPFITGKNFVFRIAVELAFFLFLALSLVDRSYRPKWNLLSISFALFAAVIFIADIFSLSPSSALWSNFERMEGFVTLAHLLLYFIVSSSVLKSGRDWQTWITATTSVSVFMVLFCFLQITGEAVINQGGVRVDGLLGNAAYLAAYFLFHIFFLVYLASSKGLESKEVSKALSIGTGAYVVYYLLRLSTVLTNIIDHNKGTTYGYVLLGVAALVFVLSILPRVWSTFAKHDRPVSMLFYALILGSELFIIYSTATRGAILGLVGGLLLTAILIAWREKENKLLKRGAMVVVGSILVIVAVFVAVKDTTFVQNDPVLSRFASISWSDKTQAREYVWPMAIQGFKERPVFGWGQEGFIYVFEKNYVPEMFVHEPWFDRAHNSYLDWLIAGGVLGFLGYISLYAFAVVLLWKSASWTDRSKAVLTGLIAAYAFQNLFIFDNLVSYFLFVSLLALIASGYNQAKDDVSGGDREEAGAPILVSAVVVFVIVAFLINYNAYKQNKVLIRALSSGGEGASVVLDGFNKALSYDSFGTFETRTQLLVSTTQVIAAGQVSDADKLKFATRTLEEFQKQIAKTPNDARAYLMLGDFMSSIGNFDDSITLLEKARAISPKKQQILISLAQAYIRKGDATKDVTSVAVGLAIAKQAYELSPDFDGMKMAYIQLLAATGKIDEVIAVAGSLKDTSGLVNESLIKAFIEGNRTQDAIALLRKEIARDNKYANAYVMLANVYLYLHDKQTAIQLFKDLEAVSPELTEAIEKDIAQIKKM